jgi:hypothetical protein
MKQMFAVLALIAVSGLLTGVVFAQDVSTVNGANLRSDGTWQNFDQTKRGPPTVPKYCKPCLFYGGDTDTSSQDWAAWANEDNTVANAVFTNYVPFVVPKGKTWTVTALFTNNVTLNGQTGGPGPAKIHPSKGLWSISKGISTGHAGKKVASGQGTASFKPTGRDFKNANGDHFEYTLLVKLAKPVKLTAGKYWLTAVPECTDSSQSDCQTGFYFNSNSTSRTNKFGPAQPKAMDFANAPTQGLNFANVCTEQGATPASCAYQSVGVVGTQK